MKNRALCFLMLALGAALSWSGCNGDEQFPNSGENGQNNSSTNAPAKLAAKSYTFTVTADNSFAEEFSNEYTIDFQTETTYVLHPSQQNRPIPDLTGNYSYDRRSGVVHLIESNPVQGRTVDMVLTFLSPTSGTAHLVGSNNETEDAVFVQTAVQ
jgi:hypothetical protein